MRSARPRCACSPPSPPAWAWRWKARLFDETSACSGGPSSAMPGFGRHQQHPAGHRRVAGLPGHRRPRRRQAARGAAHRRPVCVLARCGERAEPLSTPTSTAFGSGCHRGGRSPAVRGRRSSGPGAPWSSNTVSEGAHIAVVPGTDEPQSTAYVPIVGGDRLLGVLQTENFSSASTPNGEPEIRLLTTIASALGVALQGAQRFDETSACSRRPSSAMPNWPSSTACRRAWRRSWTCRRSTTWSATRCAGSSTRSR